MAGIIFRTGAALSLAAAASMAATPALARDRGWGGGWGHRHHDGDGFGDFLTGVLVIGGIAAVASAVANSHKDRNEPPPQRYPDRAYPADERGADYGADNRPEWRAGQGINAAVNRCMDAVETGRDRVDSVDAVSRQGDGWRIDGRMEGDRPFTCAIDSDGGVRDVHVG